MLKTPFPITKGAAFLLEAPFFGINLLKGYDSDNPSANGQSA